MHIGIAGAGLLGRLLAWKLLLQGHEVSVFEAGSLRHPTAAAHTAAAMIAPLSERVDSNLSIYNMGLQGLDIWPFWIRELGGNIQYQRKGSLVVAHAQDASQLQQFHQQLSYQLGSNGNYQWLDGADITALEPDLHRFQKGLYLRDEAHLDNRHFLDVLRQQILNLGGQCFEHTPVSRIDNGQLYTDRRRVIFDRVIDCRGVGAKPMQPAIRGIRGEVLWVETTEVQFQRPIRFMHPRYKLYVVPKPGNRYIIGATEIESEDLSPVSLQSSLELSSALYALNPAFAEARIIDFDVNLRPAFIDNMPRIIERDRCIHVNGLYRHGYLLAPTVVNAVLALLEHKPHPFLSTLLQPMEAAHV